MCWKCDHPNAPTRREEDLDELCEAVSASHGWVVKYVENDNAPYAYTIGLHDSACPNSDCDGRNDRAAHRL